MVVVRADATQGFVGPLGEPSPAGRRRRCGRSASRGRRRFELTREPVAIEPGDMGIAGVELLLDVLERLPAAKSAVADPRADAGRGDPEPASAVSNVIGTSSPALGERGPVTTSSALAPRCRAAMAL